MSKSISLRGTIKRFAAVVAISASFLLGGAVSAVAQDEHGERKEVRKEERHEAHEEQRHEAHEERRAEERHAAHEERVAHEERRVELRRIFR